jgi:membrane protein DedA with SNARE-associated domain/rhodanese-related sulfurtransferase
MQRLITLIETYGLVVVFLNVLAETAGLPLPAYPALIVAAALAWRGDYSMWQLLAVAISAALIADSAWYWAGKHYGRKVLNTICRVSLSPDFCVRQTESLFAKWGAASLTFAKFIPGFGSLATALAGTTRIRIPLFLTFDAIGALAWSGVAIVLGVAFRKAIRDVLDVLEDLGRWGLVLIGSLLALYLLAKWWQRVRLLRQLRMDRITVEELEALIRDNKAPIVLDVRTVASQQAGGIIPGSIAVTLKELKQLSSRLQRDAEIIVCCACPNEASAAQVARALKQLGFKKVRPLKGGIDAWVAAGRELTRFELASAS